MRKECPFRSLIFQEVIVLLWFQSVLVSFRQLIGPLTSVLVFGRTSFHVFIFCYTRNNQNFDDECNKERSFRLSQK